MFLGSLLLAFAAPVLQAPAVAPVALPAPPEFAAPKAAFAIQAKQSLLEVVEAFADATGQPIVVDPDLGGLLKSQKSGLLRDVSVPPERAWTYVEALLAFHGVLWSIEVREAPMLVSLRSYSSGRGSGPATQPQPIVVDNSKLGWFERHPGFFGRVAIELPHTDVRQLVNSLRTIQSANSAFDQMINAGQANSVILTGLGTNLVQTARLLQMVDEHSSRMPPPAAAPAGAKNTEAK
jgi:hypothetical protein